MTLIDTHTHLFLPEFNEDRDEMMQRAFDAGVDHFYLPNIDTGTVQAMHNLVTAYPDNCKAMMGLHPGSVNKDFEMELQMIEGHLNAGQYVAVGEIGIDLYWDKTFIEQQKEAFKIQVQWAKDLDLPIVIHTRDSFRESIEILKPMKDEHLNGIFHCFSGTYEEAQEVIELGFYMGIGGVVTFKNAGLDKVVAQLPLDHLVLETDSPYLTPAPHRGKRNESSYLKLVAEKVAEVMNVSLEEVAQHTTRNALKIFKSL